MADDPDVLDILAELEAEEEHSTKSAKKETVTNKDDNNTERAKEETAFKADISKLKSIIAELGFRTLGEYLASLGPHDCKRTR
jgi:hypothetical protein